MKLWKASFKKRFTAGHSWNLWFVVSVGKLQASHWGKKYYTWVYFGKLPWKMGKYVTVDLIRMQPKLAMVSWQYVVNKCIILFLCLHIMGNGSLKSSQMDPRAQGRKPPCLAHSVCAALHGIGLWDLQSWKKCSISLFSVLNRVTIIF